LDLTLTAAERRFQEVVCDFFEREYPADLLTKVRSGQRLTRDDHIWSQRALQSRGWLGLSWPCEFGGPGWTPVCRYLFESELERVGAPSIIPMAVIYLGPLIIKFGTPEQQRRWLPDILQSRAMWAQGYSEPQAGSDLASLGLKAQRDGSDYILNGAKIWTTLAQWADWIFCLARTSTGFGKHDGISFICVDMRSAGVTVEPIITLNGAWELNRVSFDNVRVPTSNRVGEEGKGWHYANVLLNDERLSYAHVGRKKADVEHIRRLAASRPSTGAPLLNEPLFAARLAALEIEVATLEIAVLRALVGQVSPRVISTLKIKCTECAQHVTELYLELAGRHIAPYPDRSGAGWYESLLSTPTLGPLTADAYLFERAQTIYGGTTEIQKGIIWRELNRR
jgi:alkylation response protein AidB-like acyl-CoA dehydrogenase